MFAIGGAAKPDRIPNTTKATLTEARDGDTLSCLECKLISLLCATIWNGRIEKGRPGESEGNVFVELMSSDKKTLEQLGGNPFLTPFLVDTDELNLQHVAQVNLATPDAGSLTCSVDEFITQTSISRQVRRRQAPLTRPKPTG